MTTVLDAAALAAALPDIAPARFGVPGSLVLALRAPDFPAAARLVAAVAEHAEALDHHPDLDLRWRTVTFTLSTHSAGGVTELDVELARRILAAGRATGAQALPVPERVEVCLDAAQPDAVLPFWETALGYRRHRLPGGDVELHHPTGQGPVLWFQTMDPPRPGRGRFHLDVYVPAAEAAARVRAVVAAGGRLVTDTHAPSWWVLADAEGNEVCVCTDEPQPRG